MKFQVGASLSLLFAAAVVSGFTVEVEPSERLCFHETLKAGERMMVGFQVQDGPNFEIDFYMEDPRAITIDKQLNTGGYEKNYDIEHDGRHTYCFHNTHSGNPSKLLSFYVFRDDLDKVKKIKELKEPLDKELFHLKEGLRSVKEEQQYIILRERIHRNTAESTNSRVLWWSIFETVMLVAVCMWQVWYLKRFFEVKRAL